jgi:hypothetical protein
MDYQTIDLVLSVPYINAGNASQEQLNNLNFQILKRSSRCIIYLKYNPYSTIWKI